MKTLPLPQNRTIRKPTKMKLNFTLDQLQKFDNAMDHLADKEFELEVRHQPPRMIGDTLLTYSVVEHAQTHKQRLVQLTLQGAKCDLRVFEMENGKKSTEVPLTNLIR